MPKISRAHGPTSHRSDLNRTEALRPVTVPDELPVAEALPTGETETAPVPDAPETPATGKDGAEALPTGETETKPAPKMPRQRRTARG
jgi:hypothetical protein